MCAKAQGLALNPVASPFTHTVVYHGIHVSDGWDMFCLQRNSAFCLADRRDLVKASQIVNLAPIDPIEKSDLVKAS